MARKPNTKCIVCNKKFYKRLSQKTSSRHFCSWACYCAWRSSDADPRAISMRQCGVCKKEFRPARREQKFCSVRCAASRPLQKRKNGRGKNKSQWVLACLKNRGWDGKCMIAGCNYSTVMDAHRIVAGKDGGEYNCDNVCAICPNHHAEIHRLKCNIVRVADSEFVLVC